MSQATVKFKKSGVPYGYGYTDGETGTINAEDLPKLVEAGVVVEAKETKDAPEAKK